MSRIYISEYSRLGLDFTGAVIDAPMAPAVAEQSLEIMHEERISSFFNSATRFIIITADADCCIAIGSTPKANPRMHKVHSGETRRYGVSHEHRLAVIVSEE